MNADLSGMSSSGAAIRALPFDVVAKLKSTTSITQLNGVIVELAKNSLDASAHTIHISVDFKRGSCIVEDDGDGILPAEFESAGGLGKAHHTSKFQSSSAYGHRGLFLTSLASLSLLTVTSRHVGHQSTNSVIFHHSKPVARLIPAPAHQTLQISEHGTCVTVNDLFGNMPVRVKSRALALEKADELEKEWNNLRYILVSLMLANRRLSKLVLSDVARGKRISIRFDSTTPIRNEYIDLPNDVNLGRIGTILAQSGMTNSRNMDSWHVISATIPDLNIQIAISTVPCPSKRLQFISLNTEPVLSRSNSNILFNEVNQLVLRSDFGNPDAASRSTPATCPSRAGRSDAQNSGSGRSWAKPINKWPMFYIRIDTSSVRHLDDAGQEASPDSEKSLQRITDVLGAMITEFLRQQSMRPRISKRRGKVSDQGRQVDIAGPKGSSKKDDTVSSTDEAFSGRLKLPSFQRSQTVNSGQHFHNWSRVKTAKGPETPVLPTGLENQDPGSDDHRVEAQNQLSRARYRPGQKQPTPANHARNHRPLGESKTPSGLQREADDDEAKGDTSQLSDDTLIPWDDPRTGKRHMINSRTGQTVISKASSGSVGTFRLGRLQEPRSGSASAHNLWVENMLQTWDNPTFSRTEVPVPSLDLRATYSNTTSFHNSLRDILSLDAAGVARFRGKIPRDGLESAAVISQVDHKFILAKIHGGSTKNTGDDSDSALVLIDQHAADERCRIEQLFEEMFVSTETSYQSNRVQTAVIEPITFDVSLTESKLLEKYLDFFGDWGVCYDIEADQDVGATVSVHALPILIAERCRLEPSLVVDLLRREIWASEEDGRKPVGATAPLSKKPSEVDDLNPSGGGESYSIEAATGTDHTRHSWVQRMSGCPQGIFDLLNSRACRGAIMFNDPLSADECKALVARLARCAFPFQCAHGRPSMIPILGLRQRLGHDPVGYDADIMESDYDDYDNQGLDFLEAFRNRYRS
ncbi:uncharacterized protein N7459_009884 [Penicillium hispanicum]|uniref:uncharacterized protein n=1 Tax=Penicillium hispanicum TaxID=1080232 RepID=UPI0025403529|nr:uncharacterized protein N7459_009884 [Penicillium hispanicum]KAJ5570454.1 hypothetical protein N7459_009884 [Penicillium hispanicum]